MFYFISFKKLFAQVPLKIPLKKLIKLNLCIILFYKVEEMQNDREFQI